MTKKRHVLIVRCSDGLTTRPPELIGTILHQIRVPGGILFPNLCEQQNGEDPDVVGRLLSAMLFSIETMVRLKSPDEIVLMSHDPCGAALAMNLTETDVSTAYLEWAVRIREHFPHIPVTIIHERHCRDGHWREPHIAVAA